MKLRIAVLLLLVSTVAARPAQATPMSLTLTSPLLSGMPGDTLTFSGTIADLGGSPTFLNGTNFLTPFPLDDTPFFINTPPVLPPNQLVSGALFTVSVTAGTVPGLYGGSFSILGGTNPAASGVLATQNFQVNVTTAVPVPEPGTATLLLLGAAAARLVRRRRSAASSIGRWFSAWQ